MVIVPRFLGVESGQQQHTGEHNDGCEQQKIHCSQHAIMKNIGNHDRSILTPRGFYCSAADFGAINSA
jgi:hypothetical protein